MNQLIKITEKEGKQLVSARELYLGLGLNKTQWSRWYPKNIQENEFFTKDVDFTGVRLNVEGNEVQDFAITLDFAKHIAMMARTEKSHEYRNYFISCEEKLRQQSKPTCIEDVLISSLQEMKAIRNEVQAVKKATEETKESIQGIRDVVSLTPNAWRKDTSILISKIAMQLGGFEHIKDVREESYNLLNQTFKVDVDRRLNNKRKNMALEGVSKSKIKNLNALDVISEDAKLINGYISIVSKMAIKYGAV